MRPGQTAPENDLVCITRREKLGCFNEAGANCPGKQRKACCWRPVRELASMRPGQTAPENPVKEVHKLELPKSFNEAGANCPGKLGFGLYSRPVYRCFNEAGANCPGKPRYDFVKSL